MAFDLNSALGDPPDTQTQAPQDNPTGGFDVNSALENAGIPQDWKFGHPAPEVLNGIPISQALNSVHYDPYVEEQLHRLQDLNPNVHGAKEYLGNAGASLNNSLLNTLWGIQQHLAKAGAPSWLSSIPKGTDPDQLIAATRAHQSVGADAPGSGLGQLGASVLETSMFPGSIVGQTLGQGLLGAAQPTLGNESAISNGLQAGGNAALYGVAGNLASLRPLVMPFSAQASEDVEALGRAGIPLDTSQSTGSRLASTLKNWIADNPFIGGSGFREDLQLPASTRAVLGELGQPGASVADATAMNKITGDANRIRNEVFDEARNPIDITDNHPITTPQKLFGDKPVPPQHWQNLTTTGPTGHQITGLSPNAPLSLNKGLDVLWDRASQEVENPEGLTRVKNIITQLRSEARSNGGVIPGNVLQSMRSSISGLSQFGPKEKEIGGVLGELMDTAFASQESVPGDAQRLFQANRTLNAVQPIRDSLVKGARKGIEDQVDLPTLYSQLLSAKNSGETLGGSANPVKQNIIDLARAGSNVMGKSEPKPGGLAARVIAPALALGTVEEGLSGDPSKALTAGAFGAISPLLSKWAVYGAIPRATANNPFFHGLYGGITRGSAALANAPAAQGSSKQYKQDLLETALPYLHKKSSETNP